MNIDLLYDYQEISRTWTSREDHTHPCALIMLLRPLLRTTQGSCRYGTTHGVDVHTERDWLDGVGAWLRLCRRAAGWPDGSIMMMLHCCCRGQRSEREARHFFVASILRARRAGHEARTRARLATGGPRSISRRPSRAASRLALRGRRENGPPVEKDTIILCHIRNYQVNI